MVHLGPPTVLWPFLIFSQRASDSRESPQKTLRFENVSTLKSDSQEKGVQFGNPATIRENQAIRANLRIDSRESGHLRVDFVVTLVEGFHSRPNPGLPPSLMTLVALEPRDLETATFCSKPSILLPVHLIRHNSPHVLVRLNHLSPGLR